MDITRVAKSHQTGSAATGKTSFKKDWKLSDSLREKISEYAREDAGQNVYMGNNFLALRKSEIDKVASGRIALMRKLNLAMTSGNVADMKKNRGKLTSGGCATCLESRMKPSFSLGEFMCITGMVMKTLRILWAWVGMRRN